MTGAKPKPCSPKAKNLPAGTGSLWAPSSVWTTAPRPPADAPSLANAVMPRPAWAWRNSCANSIAKPWPAASARPRMCWSSPMERCGFGTPSKTASPRPGSVLDLYHGEEHLWAVAHELYGKGTPEACQWVAPLLKQLRRDQSAAVITTLRDLQPTLEVSLHQKVQTQIQSFENHKNRMEYRQIIEARKACDKGTATAEQRLKANEPLGSGAIESTCRQYQCRFKRTGQFWTMEGDEALMCLETFWRNNRWHQLYPHVNLSSPSLN